MNVRHLRHALSPGVQQRMLLCAKALRRSAIRPASFSGGAWPFFPGLSRSGREAKL